MQGAGIETWVEWFRGLLESGAAFSVQRGIDQWPGPDGRLEGRPNNTYTIRINGGARDRLLSEKPQDA